MKVFTVLAFTLATTVASAHKDKPHAKGAIAQVPSETPAHILSEINAAYLQTIKPIFKVSCFNCHSSQTEFPWYAKLPGVKQLIENDVRESKEHLDLTNDFPFGGHGDGPIDDLKAIRDSVVNSDMPPFRYWVMHPSSRLSDDQKKAVTVWVDQSLAKLQN